MSAKISLLWFTILKFLEKLFAILNVRGMGAALVWFNLPTTVLYQQKSELFARIFFFKYGKVR